MNVILNGSPREVPDGVSAGDLIVALGLGNRRLALEVNTEIVPRSRLATYRLNPGDRVEIVQAIGGG